MVPSFSKWRVHYITLEIVNHIVHENGNYRITGSSPCFILHSSRSKFPSCWVIISYLIESQGTVLEPILYIDNGNGFSEQHTILLPHGNGRIETVVRLPDQVRAIRLDPSSRAGVFCLREMKIFQINKVIALWRLINRKLIYDLVTPERFQNIRNKLLHTWKNKGWSGIRFYLASLIITITRQQISLSNYGCWIRAYDTITRFDREKILERMDGLKNRPLLSIMIPIYNINERWLYFVIDSILSQLYPEWELYIVFNSSGAPLHVIDILQKYQSNDQRIKVIFQINGHTLASNSTLELMRGEWIVLMDQDSELAEHALYMIAEEINAHPQVNIIYSDEDKIDVNGQRYEPWFKPNWNPDLMLSNNQIAHLGVYRATLVKEVGGFKSNYEGSQSYDLMLRVIEKNPVDRIRHIPHILYHWHPINESSSDNKVREYQYQTTRNLLQDYLDRNYVNARVTAGCNSFSYRIIYSLPERLPKVSVIIPTKDMLDLLQVAIEGLLDKTDYPDMEIIIVNNQSKLPETLTYLDKIKSLSCVQLLHYNAPYNYSAINNWAVQQAKGDLIALLNNDIEVITPGWLKEMVSHAIRPEIGAVGAMLYYPDDTIQHAGIILGLNGPAGHVHRDFLRNSPGYFGRARLIQNFSAVTAACIVMRRAIFEEIGGFDEDNLAVAYNDVDLCLRIQKKGYRILWTPYAELYHHESTSLGPPEAPERRKQFLKEMAYIKTRWKDIIEQDPFYNQNLTLGGGDFSLAFPPRLRKPWRDGE